MKKFIKRAGVAVAVLLTAVLATVGVAHAVLAVFVGTTTSFQRDHTENAPWVTPVGAGWWNVTSTNMPISLNDDKIVESTFGASSVCAAAAYCSVRVVAIGAGGVIEFNPVAGAGFVFDSPAGGPREQHSMHRVQRLPEGNYTIVVQAQIVGPMAGAAFVLDDYTHFIDVVDP
ncbi:hypothetical protein JOF56_011201 [Kibdelosporangium banguiense]|uniref:Uncharacterized protein n=1 Tax=Kibdelosporangium banguiense TaxID=1365924 RepID=A0ABS4U2E7_9PSEU|nr:hypothetical protein [Kibdelosporangium banguiense]MBP2330816.1 hypothetical protein [Kibdelosporangium banguiense]